jgi:hypothetical protein
VHHRLFQLESVAFTFKITFLIQNRKKQTYLTGYIFKLYIQRELKNNYKEKASEKPETFVFKFLLFFLHLEKF